MAKKAPPPPAPVSPPATATYSLRNKRPRPQSSTSPGVTASVSRLGNAGLEDESDLSSLSDDSDDNKPIDADDGDDDEEAPQSEYEEDKKVVVPKKAKVKVVAPKRKPGRPKKVVVPPPAPAPPPATAPQPAQDTKEPEPPALPSPTSLHSPPVRTLERRPTLQDGPFSHPPASIEPPHREQQQMQHKDSPTPLLQNVLLGRLGDLISEFRIDAERDEAFQNNSQAEVETSILRLPTRKHRSALCLTMNRYSAFCASPSVDVPAFPITSYKIALFLARSSPSRTGRTLLHLLPQPHTFSLPIAPALSGTLSGDPTRMGKGEGDVVTRELVKSWIEALGYAQGATASVWTGRLRHPHEVGRALLDAPHIVELLGTFDTLVEVQSAGYIGLKDGTPDADGPDPGNDGPDSDGRRSVESSGEPARKKTKWVRGGKSVDAPKIKPSGSPFDESLSPNLAHLSPPLSGPSTPLLSAAQPDSTWYNAAAATQPQASTGYSFAPSAPPADPRRSSSVGYAMGGYDSQTFPRGPPPAQYYQPSPAPAPAPPAQQLRTAPPPPTTHSPSQSAATVDHSPQDHSHPHSHHSDDANEVDEFEGDGDGGKSASSQHTSGREDSPDKPDFNPDESSSLAMPPPNSKPSPHVPSHRSPYPVPASAPTAASQWYTTQEPLPPLQAYPPPPAPSSLPPSPAAYRHPTGPGGYPLQSAYHHPPPPPPPSSQQQHAYQQGYWSSSAPHAQGYYSAPPRSYAPQPTMSYAPQPTMSYAPQPTMSYAQSSSSSYPHHQPSYAPPSSSYQASSSSSSSYPSSYVPLQRLGLDTNLASSAGPGPGMSAYSPSTMYSPSTYQREWGGYSYGSAAPAGGER